MDGINKFNFNMKKIFLLVFTVSLLSCESNDPKINPDNLLLGVWLAPVYNGETTTFKRGHSLPNDAYGISFQQDGVFLERTSGWCGTPPLSFFNVDGTFQLDNTLISISTQSYPNNYAWRIVSLSESELIVKRELTEQEKDHRALMDLFTEIENLAYSANCTNANDWQFAAYGAKACGGPQGYIPYSNKIDTASFLQKIAAYTQAEKDYNFKWGVISDCSIVNPPKTIECQNGFPVVKY